MGKRGPLAAPKALKLARGTFREDRTPAIAAAAGEPPMPPELDAEARRIWREVVPGLLALGTLAPTDGGTLAGYCSTLSQALQTQKGAVARPHDAEETAEWVRERAASESRKLWVLVDRFALRLGLNFAARGRM